jgi:tetratricopeptide (TPR) repeat protein
MAEEGDTVSAGTKGDAAAVGVAMNAGAAAEEARSYLREQTELAKLQKQNLLEQNAFELSHLRWRRFNDQLSGALRIMAVLLGAVLLLGIAALLWNASKADGLVVDSFSVSPALAPRGISGDVLAKDITNRIAAIRDYANAHSLAQSGAVRQDDSVEIKVDIPNTGISLDEVWRFLRNGLGRERHVAGSLDLTSDGRMELEAHLSGDAVSVRGAANDLSTMEQNLAERVFSQIDPINGTVYLLMKGDDAAAHRQAGLLTRSAPPEMLADSYAVWSETTAVHTGDVPRSIILAQVAIALDPKLAIAHRDLAGDEEIVGRDEAVLREDRIALNLHEDEQPSFLRGRGFQDVRLMAEERIAALTGDYARAEMSACGGSCLPAGLDNAALYAALQHDVTHALTLIRTAKAIERRNQPAEALAEFEAAAAAGNWARALAAARGLQALLAAHPDMASDSYAPLEAKGRPLLARALARTADFRGAWNAIGGTPLDCYQCNRARAVIDVAERKWAAAAWWFARTVKLAPSIPFAYSDWGEMLLCKGDLDGAIAKFSAAHEKGPHFADPLEMWGEALIAKNRTDLALAKFEEANKYAPNWGRLHVKWGEALQWSGDKPGAEKQFAAAARLDLTPSEKSELARVSHG